MQPSRYPPDDLPSWTPLTPLPSAESSVSRELTPLPSASNLQCADGLGSSLSLDKELKPGSEVLRKPKTLRKYLQTRMREVLTNGTLKTSREAHHMSGATSDRRGTKVTKESQGVRSVDIGVDTGNPATEFRSTDRELAKTKAAHSLQNAVSSSRVLDVDKPPSAEGLLVTTAAACAQTEVPVSLPVDAGQGQRTETVSLGFVTRAASSIPNVLPPQIEPMLDGGSTSIAAKPGQSSNADQIPSYLSTETMSLPKDVPPRPRASPFDLKAVTTTPTEHDFLPSGLSGASPTSKVTHRSPTPPSKKATFGAVVTLTSPSKNVTNSPSSDSSLTQLSTSPASTTSWAGCTSPRSESPTPTTLETGPSSNREAITSYPSEHVRNSPSSDSSLTQLSTSQASTTSWAGCSPPRSESPTLTTLETGPSSNREAITSYPSKDVRNLPSSDSSLTQLSTSPASTTSWAGCSPPRFESPTPTTLETGPSGNREAITSYVRNSPSSDSSLARLSTSPASTTPWAGCSPPRSEPPALTTLETGPSGDSEAITPYPWNTDNLSTSIASAAPFRVSTPPPRHFPQGIVIKKSLSKTAAKRPKLVFDGVAVTIMPKNIKPRSFTQSTSSLSPPPTPDSTSSRTEAPLDRDTTKSSKYEVDPDGSPSASSLTSLSESPSSAPLPIEFRASIPSQIGLVSDEDTHPSPKPRVFKPPGSTVPSRASTTLPNRTKPLSEGSVLSESSQIAFRPDGFSSGLESSTSTPPLAGSVEEDVVTKPPPLRSKSKSFSPTPSGFGSISGSYSDHFWDGVAIPQSSSEREYSATSPQPRIDKPSSSVVPSRASTAPPKRTRHLLEGVVILKSAPKTPKPDSFTSSLTSATSTPSSEEPVPDEVRPSLVRSKSKSFSRTPSGLGPISYSDHIWDGVKVPQSVSKRELSATSPPPRVDKPSTSVVPSRASTAPPKQTKLILEGVILPKLSTKPHSCSSSSSSLTPATSTPSEGLHVVAAKSSPMASEWHNISPSHSSFGSVSRSWVEKVRAPISSKRESLLSRDTTIPSPSKAVKPPSSLASLASIATPKHPPKRPKFVFDGVVLTSRSTESNRTNYKFEGRRLSARHEFESTNLADALAFTFATDRKNHEELRVRSRPRPVMAPKRSPRERWQKKRIIESEIEPEIVHIKDTNPLLEPREFFMSTQAWSGVGDELWQSWLSRPSQRLNLRHLIARTMVHEVPREQMSIVQTRPFGTPQKTAREDLFERLVELFGLDALSRGLGDKKPRKNLRAQQEKQTPRLDSGLSPSKDKPTSADQPSIRAELPDITNQDHKRRRDIFDEDGPASKKPRIEVDQKDVTEDMVLGWTVVLQRLIKGKTRIDHMGLAEISEILDLIDRKREKIDLRLLEETKLVTTLEQLSNLVEIPFKDEHGLRGRAGRLFRLIERGY